MKTRNDRESSRGFTFMEIVVAVTLLALCLVPILNLSTSGVRETAVSREDILARHLLMDLVERYRSSPVEELEMLPSSTTMDHVAPGQDDPEVATDDVLKERTARLLSLQGIGRADGLDTFRSLVKSMGISRMVAFEKDKLGTGKHQLTCIVRWIGKSGKEKRIDFARPIVRG